jgi:hypothetical protein
VLVLFWCCSGVVGAVLDVMVTPVGAPQAGCEEIAVGQASGVAPVG